MTFRYKRQGLRFIRGQHTIDNSNLEVSPEPERIERHQSVRNLASDTNLAINEFDAVSA